jgi:O-antigen ligase
MPLTFPPLAFILFQCWPHLERLIAIHFGLALTILLLNLRFSAIFAGETVIPLIQHNQIHGAVCCGMLLIGALFWLLYYLTEGADEREMRLYASVVAPSIGVLCLVGIYGAKSKGVWLSLVPVLPVLAFFIMRSLKQRTAALAIVCIASLFSVGIYAVRDNLYRTAGPTIASTISMLEDAGTREQVGNAVAQTIDSGVTPISMNERLQLWSNAWELFSAAPVFGWGSEWLELWPHTHYSHVQYTFMHNGYLEILIRYGLFGAAIFTAMLACFCFSVYRAAQLAIIPRHAMHAYFMILIFFSLTILSNSNNRLASGESLSILTAAFALACQLKIRMLERKQAAPVQ